MIGMFLTHTPSGICGNVQETAVDPAGLALARIHDKWFMVGELEG